MFNRFLIKIKGLFPTKFKTFIKKFRKFNGYDGLDKKMLKYINYSNGFYIECGANDGVSQSNTWYFEKELNWKGLLIEPVNHVFRELKKNRNNNNFFSNKALCPINFKQKFIYLNLDLKDTLSTRSTEDNIKSRVKIKVKTENLNSILNKIKAPKIIDFFSLDVEGDEFKVLNGINFKKYKFKYILIETYHLKKIKNFFEMYGYKYVKKMSDRNDHLFKFHRTVNKKI